MAMRLTYTATLQAEAEIPWAHPPDLPEITDASGWQFIRPIRRIHLTTVLQREPYHELSAVRIRCGRRAASGTR